MKLSEAALGAQTKFKIPSSVAEALKIQLELKKYVRLKSLPLKKVKNAVALDVSYDRQEELARAAAVVFDFPSGQIIDVRIATTVSAFPYIPGLLAFREIPAILSVLADVDFKVQLILCEGHGIAHPRGFGLASHLGVLLGLPTIGVAKNRLYGVIGAEKYELDGFEYCYLYDPSTSEVVGAALQKNKKPFKPIFVSPGHLAEVNTGILVAIHLSDNYRLLPQLRLAHKFSRFTKGSSFGV
jgi:deoxyribonuclease V